MLLVMIMLYILLQMMKIPQFPTAQMMWSTALSQPWIQALPIGRNQHSLTMLELSAMEAHTVQAMYFHWATPPLLTMPVTLLVT